MIKKFNELMDDIPTIVKVIIGIVLIGLNLIIINLFFAVDVFAYGTQNASNIRLTYANDNYIDVNNNSSNLTLMSNVKAITYDYGNLNEVISGHAYFNINQSVARGSINARVFTNNVPNPNCTTYVDGGTDGSRSEYDIYFDCVYTTQGYTVLRLDFTNNLSMLKTIGNIYGSVETRANDNVKTSDLQNAIISIMNNAINNTLQLIDTNELLNSMIIQKLEEQNQTCENYNYTNAPIGETGKYLDNGGNIMILSSYNLSEYIRINKNKSYNITLTNYGTSSITASYCLYDKNKVKLSCSQYGTNREINIIPSEDGYIRYSMGTINNRETKFTGIFCQTNTEAINERLERQLDFWEEIKQMEDDNNEEQKGLLQSIISGIGNIFGFIEDDETDDPTSDITALSNQMGSNTVISDLLLLPVSLFQSIVNSLGGTCQSFNLGTLYNHTITYPCINLQSIIGSTLYNVIDILISGMFVLVIRKKFIEIFNNFTSLKIERNELE